jgi:hypothetical protein
MLYVEAGVAFFARYSNSGIGLPRKISQFFRFFPLNRGFCEKPEIYKKQSADRRKMFFMIVGFG